MSFIKIKCSRLVHSDADAIPEVLLFTERSGTISRIWCDEYGEDHSCAETQDACCIFSEFGASTTS